MNWMEKIESVFKKTYVEMEERYLAGI